MIANQRFRVLVSSETNVLQVESNGLQGRGEQASIVVEIVNIQSVFVPFLVPVMPPLS